MEPGEPLKRALAIFAKAPIAGQVKTRLVPALGLDGTVELYRCFLLDTVELALQVSDCETFLFYTPSDGAPLLRAIIGERVVLVPQSSGDLGERMRDGFQDLFVRGFEAVIIIGTDLPTLPLTRLTTALVALERMPIVLGPSLDGGYYLIGLRTRQPELFQGIAWSTPHVISQTLDRINALGLQMESLEPWYDVDTVEDFNFLVSHLRLLLTCGKSNLPRQSVSLLRQLGKLP